VVAEAESARDQFEGKVAALIWLRDRLPTGGDVRMRIAAVLPHPAPPGVQARPLPPPSAWVAALEALTSNADAALPA
jgi:hypothetical protein